MFMNHRGYINTLTVSALIFFSFFVSIRRDFLIFQDPGKPAVQITDNKFKDKVKQNCTNFNRICLSVPNMEASV